MIPCTVKLTRLEDQMPESDAKGIPIKLNVAKTWPSKRRHYVVSLSNIQDYLSLLEMCIRVLCTLLYALAEGCPLRNYTTKTSFNW